MPGTKSQRDVLTEPRQKRGEEYLLTTLFHSHSGPMHGLCCMSSADKETEVQGS